jgi:hypothetical protein
MAALTETSVKYIFNATPNIQAGGFSKMTGTFTQYF